MSHWAVSNILTRVIASRWTGTGLSALIMAGLFVYFAINPPFGGPSHMAWIALIPAGLMLFMGAVATSVGVGLYRTRSWARGAAAKLTLTGLVLFGAMLLLAPLSLFFSRSVGEFELAIAIAVPLVNLLQVLWPLGVTYGALESDELKRYFGSADAERALTRD